MIQFHTIAIFAHVFNVIFPMEQLKHECGIAMIRLRKPLDFYRQKYGTLRYGLDKLYLMMEKQHNRGQEAAGVGIVNMNAQPGHEYVWRERAMGTQAIQDIFANIFPKLDEIGLSEMTTQQAVAEAPYIGEIMMGHLRYSTTGRSGINYVHPFLRRNNWRSRNLLLCGNFNLTNVDEIFNRIAATGQHPRLYSDTIMVLEQLGYALDKENHRIYRQHRDSIQDPELARTIEDNIDLRNVLKATAPYWDGGYAMCLATGSGDMAVIRDPRGIRPAFYYVDDEVVVVASERPVIQTVWNVPVQAVRELDPGAAIIAAKNGDVNVSQLLPQIGNHRCSFERIYFSRGSDAEIYNERKQLGKNLVPAVLKSVDNDIDNTVFSFIPNTAEVAFYGMMQGLEQHLDREKLTQIENLQHQGLLNGQTLYDIMRRKVRVEKVAIKDIKLRTFISEGDIRNDLAAHVYDVTYGSVQPGENLVIIDDSIVRGTTLRQSILKILDRLNPRKIVVVSSAPQVRYPDCYGIDMSRLSEFAAFRAAISLIKERGMQQLLDDVYSQCLLQRDITDNTKLRNCVKAIYQPFTYQEISDRMARMLTPDGINAEVQLIFQTIEGMHQAIPNHPGDWYFSGNYPTPGGTRLVNQAFINYYQGLPDRR